MAGRTHGIDDVTANFAAADIFYPSDGPPGVAWGATGLRMLRRMERIVATALERSGHEEIRLPTVCLLEELQHHLGPGARRLFQLAADGDHRLALAPFSDLQFLHHMRVLARHGLRRSRSHRAYAWSRCFLREATQGHLDFGEYAKCEIFSAHRSRVSAAAAWDAMNAWLRDFCVDSLCLSPLFGTRPKVTGFPFAERTWSAELAQREGGFQTIVVSHLMEDGFAAENGFADLGNIRVTSACFSQKLLAALLLHHRDEHGFRYPPSLAPTLIVAIGTPPIDTQSAERERIRVLQPSSIDPWSALLETGALCALRQRSDDEWVLYRRDTPTEPFSCHSGWAAASACAADGIRSIARTLREQSRQALAASISSLAPVATLGLAGGELVACCDDLSCQSHVARLSGWLPKLACSLEETRPCAACGTATGGALLLEKEERYTSFYLAARDRPQRPPGLEDRGLSP